MKFWGIFTIFFILYIIVIALFTLPLESKQYLIVGISGSGEDAKISYMNFQYFKKPIINIFSKINPQDGLALNLIISSKDASNNFTIYGMGSGESIFEVNGNPYKGNIAINASLYLNNARIDFQNILVRGGS